MKKIIRRFAPRTVLAVLLVLFVVTAATVWAENNTRNEIDLNFSTKIQLTTYVDGAWSDKLSGDYGFGDTANIEAPPNSGGKVFSHWEADDSVISYSNPLKLTMNAHTTLYAVYANAAKATEPVSGFTSITRTNEGDQISFQAIAGGGTVQGTGIVYSTAASGETLKIGGTGVTNVAAVKSAGLGNTLPDSVLDGNNCWMLQIVPVQDSTVYHARTYVTIGGETTYGDVKDIKLSDLESGISLVADPDGFHPGDGQNIGDLLANVKMYTVTFDANGGTGTMAPQAVLDGKETALSTNTFTRSGYTFSGWGTTKAGSVAYTDGQGVTFSADTTLYAQWEKSGGTEPSTSGESYTSPATDENTVKVSAYITSGTAVVSEITQSEIDRIVAAANKSGASGNTSITIDMSQAKSEVTAVRLSKDTMELLAQAVNAENNVDSVEVKMTNGTVRLDGAALSAVLGQAEGSSIELVVKDTEKENLEPAQQEALGRFASVKPFKAYFESNGKEIHDFNGGSATVSIKFKPEAGRDAKHYHMYYVPRSGKLERYVTRYINGMLAFVTNHFSEYAIVYDETMENETGKDDATDKSNTGGGSRRGSSGRAGGGSSSTSAGNTITSDANGGSSGTPEGGSADAASSNGSGPDATGGNGGSMDVPDGNGSGSGSPSGKTANGKTEYANAISINSGLKVSQTGSKLNVSWGKVAGAGRYEIYAAYCGKKFGTKPAKAVTKAGVASASLKKLDGEKLKLKKNFKVYVVAYKMVDGKKQKLGKTITAHVIGRKNAKYTNVKSVKLKKSKVAVKKGRTVKIEATVVLVDPSKEMLPDAHAAKFRYASSDKDIATVDKKGKVTARKEGTCHIYVYAKNGYAAKAKVTVQ